MRWRNANGERIRQDGKRVRCANCPCGGAGHCDCDAMCESYAISGQTNDPDTGFDETIFNGTYTRQVPPGGAISGCRWVKIDPDIGLPIAVLTLAPNGDDPPTQYRWNIGLPFEAEDVWVSGWYADCEIVAPDDVDAWTLNNPFYGDPTFTISCAG